MSAIATFAGFALMLLSPVFGNFIGMEVYQWMLPMTHSIIATTAGILSGGLTMMVSCVFGYGIIDTWG